MVGCNKHCVYRLRVMFTTTYIHCAIFICSYGVGLKELFESAELQNFLNSAQRHCGTQPLHGPGLSKVRLYYSVHPAGI